MNVGADTGGTFTDLVAGDGRVVKVLSTPDDPGRAVRDGLAALAGDACPGLLAHGTTVATNALLERRGARVALVTTTGMADVIEIGRGDRPSLYDLAARRPEPLVPRDLRFEVRGRLDGSGAELAPLDTAGLAEAIPDDVEAVAVCLLHADLDPVHEQGVAAVLRPLGFDVSCSSEVSPEFREYERTVTTVVNAYLRPACRPYLQGLARLAAEALVMTSGGGLVPAREAAEVPAALLLSGPAGGVRAGAAIAAACGYPDAVTFDMGGTSTDVCLVRGGVPEPSPGRHVGGFPVRLPALDIHTIGAGGGSIARIDPGGALAVGPRSAGASPGPACYGRGGTSPTVTDADLVLGRIPPDAAFPGLGALDRAAAIGAMALLVAGVADPAAVESSGAHPELAQPGGGPAASASGTGDGADPAAEESSGAHPDLAPPGGGPAASASGTGDGADPAAEESPGAHPDLAEAAGVGGGPAPLGAGGGAPRGGAADVPAALEAMAAGVVAVVDAAMEAAVRSVTVERGVDPRDLALVAFGGAGPLHACALAEALGMRAVIVPARAGALSAVGLLCSPRQREVVRSWPHQDDVTGLDDALAALAAEAVSLVGGDAEVGSALDCRYRGQSHELTVPGVDAFPAEHQRRNGYARPGTPVEVVALRARARRPAVLDPAGFPAPDRSRITGPFVAVEADCTVWIAAGWVAEPGPTGAWVLTRSRTPS